MAAHIREDRPDRLRQHTPRMQALSVTGRLPNGACDRRDVEVAAATTGYQGDRAAPVNRRRAIGTSVVDAVKPWSAGSGLGLPRRFPGVGSSACRESVCLSCLGSRCVPTPPEPGRRGVLESRARSLSRAVAWSRLVHRGRHRPCGTGGARLAGDLLRGDEAGLVVDDGVQQPTARVSAVPAEVRSPRHDVPPFAIPVRQRF